MITSTEPKTLATAKEAIADLETKNAELAAKLEAAEGEGLKTVEAFDAIQKEKEKLIKDAAVANQEREAAEEKLNAEASSRKELITALADAGIDPENLENGGEGENNDGPKTDEEIGEHYASFEPKMREARENGRHAEFCALRDERHEFYQANKKTLFKVNGITPIV